MTSVSEIAQSLTPESLISLYSVDLTKTGFGWVYFTTDVTKDGKFISFGGIEYVPWPVEAEGFEKTSKGQCPRPTLKFSSVQEDMTSLVIGSGGLLGSTLYRTVTFRRFLDDGDEPDVDKYIARDIFRIERMSEFIPKEHVTFELASPLDMEDAMFPKRQYVKSYCHWRYRVWNARDKKYSYSKIAPCPYTGIGAWDKNGLPTLPEFDVCSKTLSSCKLRFNGPNINLPYGGFPGVTQNAR